MIPVISNFADEVDSYLEMTPGTWPAKHPRRYC